MLTIKQLNEIKEHLDKCQNPLFFFDNDADGLCSFLILQRYVGSGKGVPIRGVSELGKSYFRKVEELNPDYIFILDQPSVSQEFFDLVNERGLPLVYIDHHNVDPPKIDNYYNPFMVTKTNEPTSYLCYHATKRKEDLWFAVLGCIADGYMPDFFDEFKEQYPDIFTGNLETPFDARFKTSFGKYIDVLNFGLLDTTTNVVSMIRYLTKARNIHDLLEENPQTRTFLSRYEYIDGLVKKVVQKAEENIDNENNLLFFTYGGDMSMSQHVSDILMNKYPELIIVVGFIKGDVIKFSLRGKPIDVRELTLSAIEDIEGASGGGHKHATGAQISLSDLSKFKENILKELEKIRKEK